MIQDHKGLIMWQKGDGHDRGGELPSSCRGGGDLLPKIRCVRGVSRSVEYCGGYQRRSDGYIKHFCILQGVRTPRSTQLLLCIRLWLLPQSKRRPPSRLIEEITKNAQRVYR